MRLRRQRAQARQAIQQVVLFIGQLTPPSSTDHACSFAQAFTHTRLARAHKFRNMSAASFDGQLTRANVGLAVRSGLVTEAEAQHYWEARYRHTCLSDSNSKKTSQARTADFKRARDLLLQKMSTSQGDALVQAQADKVRLEEELRALKRQRCSACLAAAGAGGQLGESTPAEEHAGRHI